MYRVRIMIWIQNCSDSASVLEQLDFVEIGLTVSNEIAQTRKTNGQLSIQNGYKQCRVLYHVRIMIWIYNCSDSASVLEKLDYFGIGLTVLNQIGYSSKTNRSLSIQNGYNQCRVMYHVRIMFWIQNCPDSASVLEQLDFFDIGLTVLNQIGYSELIRLCIRFRKVGFFRNRLDRFEPNWIFK